MSPARSSTARPRRPRQAALGWTSRLTIAGGGIRPTRLSDAGAHRSALDVGGARSGTRAYDAKDRSLVLDAADGSDYRGVPGTCRPGVWIVDIDADAGQATRPTAMSGASRRSDGATGMSCCAPGAAAGSTRLASASRRRRRIADLCPPQPADSATASTRSTCPFRRSTAAPASADRDRARRARPASTRARQPVDQAGASRLRWRAARRPRRWSRAARRSAIRPHLFDDGASAPPARRRRWPN